MKGRILVTKEIKVKSLYKALQVLECFTVNKPEMGITAISEHLGLYKSNVHSIVDTFVHAGYLEQNPENEKYRLSLKILKLSHVISNNLSFRKTLLPYMQELADATNETVYLGVPNEGEVMYLDSSLPKNKLPTRPMLGVKAPLYCTGIGKAMLAYMPEEAVETVISKGFNKYTDQTIMDEVSLYSDLVSIRARGYSIDNMEHEFGIKCVGVPLINQKREVIAGLSVSGPSLRYDEQRILEYAAGLKHIIASIEDTL
jgi:IclR family KDG regulon transcriptional repressor